MALFFRIAKDGKSVNFYKNIFVNSISVQDFNRKCERLTSREFVDRFSKDIDDDVKNRITRVREIFEMKLSALGSFDIYNENKEIIGSGYFAGDEIIDQEYAGHSVKEEALSYAKRFYGSEFMKKNEEKLNSNKVTYYSKEKEISYDEYTSLMKEINELTKISTIKKEIKFGFKR